MDSIEIIRAWRDPAFRKRLAPEKLNMMPKHPAGVVDTVELIEMWNPEPDDGEYDPEAFTTIPCGVTVVTIFFACLPTFGCTENTAMCGGCNSFPYGTCDLNTEGCCV